MDQKPVSDIKPESIESTVPPVAFGEAVRFWTKPGFISFGVPAGKIGIMQSELVDRRDWVDQADFLRGLNFAMFLPGPEAQQLATYIGRRMHGMRGALYAGLSFIVPGTFLIATGAGFGLVRVYFF